MRIQNIRRIENIRLRKADYVLATPLRMAKLWLLCASLALAACQPTPSLENSPKIPGLEQTLAAQTMAADPALFALVRTLTPSPAPPTPQATLTPASIPTNAEMETSSPSLTPIGQTLTPALDPLYAAAPCNLAEFIQDVTIPDDSVVAPGQDFVKIWQIKNIGSCTWTTGYAVALVWGNEFGTKPPIPLDHQVQPGEIIDLAIQMVAPIYPDCFQSNWMLQDEQGNRFGTGAVAKNTFWVAVSVWAPNLGVPLRVG